MQSRYSFILAVIVCSLLVAGVTTIVQAQKKKFTVKDLPAAVVSAFEKAYPKAQITGANTETEDGNTYYEVESKEGAITRDFLYTAIGKVHEIEESIVPESIPTAVKVALDSQFKKYNVEKAEKTIRGTKVTEYELIVKSGRKIFKVELDGNAKLVKSIVIKHKK